MTVRLPQKLPDPSVKWVQPDGKLTTAAYQYLRELDAAIRALINEVNAL